MMNDECKIYVHIYTKENLSADELVDAFRDAGALKQNLQAIQEDIVKAVACSDNPYEIATFFLKTIVDSMTVLGSQHKTLQELKQ